MGLVGPPSPALLTSVSMRPKAFSPASTIAFAPSSDAASQREATASPPPARTSATVSPSSASDRAAHTTFAPSRAKSRLITRPMPLLAPVTIATRSVNSPTGPPNWELGIWNLEFVHAFQILHHSAFLLLNGACFVKPRDLLLAQPEPLPQHAVRVLAEQRRGRPHGAGRFRQADRRANHPDGAGDRMRALDEHTARVHLRVHDDLAERVDRPCRNPGRQQDRGPFFVGLREEGVLQGGDERRPVRVACGIARE